MSVYLISPIDLNEINSVQQSLKKMYLFGATRNARLSAHAYTARMVLCCCCLVLMGVLMKFYGLPHSHGSLKCEQVLTLNLQPTWLLDQLPQPLSPSVRFYPAQSTLLSTLGIHLEYCWCRG